MSLRFEVFHIIQFPHPTGPVPQVGIADPHHHPKPHASSLPQADEIRQGYISAEVEGKSEYVAFFEGEWFDGFYFSDLGDDFIFDAPVDAFGEAEDVAGEDRVEQADLFGFVMFQFFEAAVMFLVEGQPVEQRVVEGSIPELYLVVVQVDIFDLVVVGVVAHPHVEVFVLEEVVDIVGAFFEADDTGFAMGDFILDQRIAINDLRIVFMVVEQRSYALGFFNHGSTETRYFVGENVVFKTDAEVSDLWH